MRTLIFTIVLASHAASAVSAAGKPPAVPWPDPCSLLTDAEVSAVQGQAPAQKVASEQPSPAFRLRQCFYRTADHARSVSVGHAVPAAAGTDGPREYWQKRFHGPEAEALRAGRKREQPPQAVAGVGDEAFWVGDGRTGALYALAGDTFLRLSVGGATDPAVRVERAKSLAVHALARLASGAR